MVTCERYDAVFEREWDEFVDQSKNPVFFFRRKYMEYHSDRFDDCSLMFREEGTLVAILPASLKEDVLSSHAGLTYGGLVLSAKVKVETVIEVLQALADYARSASVRKIIYKAIPHIFSVQPAEEDLYALFRIGATLYRRDYSSVIRLDSRLKLSKGRKWLIARAKKHDLAVVESTDWDRFHALLNSTLAKHSVQAVHTAEELGRLASLFPGNICLKVIERDGHMLAATLLFKFNRVVHTQYIASTEEGREIGALDYLIESCIQASHDEGFPYFSFGISTEDQGRQLNSGLAAQKESFGARGMVIDFYEINIT